MLGMWATNLTSSQLRATFGCGPNQAARAKNDAKVAQMIAHKPEGYSFPKPEKKCMLLSTNFLLNFAPDHRIVKNLQPSIFYDELKVEVQKFWTLSEFCHFFTHSFKGNTKKITKGLIYANFKLIHERWNLLHPDKQLNYKTFLSWRPEFIHKAKFEECTF